MALKNGWTWDSHVGASCHFRHHPLKDLRSKAQVRQRPFVVETANWTLADKRTCHLNQYFAVGMPAAIALAAHFEIAAHEVAEEVLNIRPATEEEVYAFAPVVDYFLKAPVPAISEKKASLLARTPRRHARAV